MKFTNKRLVSILLCLAMVLAVLPVAAFATGTTTLYCAAPSSWTTCKAYYWSDSNTSMVGWPGDDMTLGEDGLWSCSIPADATYIIFNNGSAQSANLDVPTDGNIQFNYDAKEWVAYGSEVEVVETVYYLRGTMNGWGATDALTNNGDGTYSITVALAAGDYMYKIGTEDWGWSCPGADATLSVTADCDVTFVLDVEAYTVTATGDGVAEAPVVEYDYYVAGDEGLCGSNWDPAGCQMNKLDDGTYTITFENVAAGSYEYKVTTGSWDTPSYGYDGNNLAVNLEVSANVTITFDPETTYVGCDVEYLEAVPSEYIKWQLNADATAESETADLRILAGLDSLNYDNVYFVIDGVEYACEAVYASVNANSNAVAASDLFDGAAYVAAYIVEGVAVADTEIVVSVIYEADGERTETVERTIVVSSNWN